MFNLFPNYYDDFSKPKSIDKHLYTPIETII